jgi:hypothetical protein
MKVVGLTVVELVLITVWAMYVMRPYLNLDPSIYAGTAEASSSIQSHHMWDRAKECGLCALWHASHQGGSPALGNPGGHVLNPLVVVTSLGWGVVNGGKVLGLTGVILLAFAQWWLARVLGLGLVARLWSAGLAVVAGHLGPRLDMGPVMASAAAYCALVWPALIALNQRPTYRRAVLLGAMLALCRPPWCSFHGRRRPPWPWSANVRWPRFWDSCSPPRS